MNKYYIGIDLHSNNLHVAMRDQDGKSMLHKKLPCDLDHNRGQSTNLDKKVFKQDSPDK